MCDRTKYMSDDELQQLRAYAEAHATTRQGTLVWLLVDTATQTGLRVSELARIRLGDIDLARGILTIVRSKKRGKPRAESLPLSPNICLHITQAMQRLYGGRQSPESSLWPGLRGPWTCRGMQQAWHAVCIAAGLSPKVSIHSARHTMAVRLLRKTGNLRMVQKQLGHSSPVTTANMYADVTFEDQQSALTSLFAPPCGSRASGT